MNQLQTFKAMFSENSVPLFPLYSFPEMSFSILITCKTIHLQDSTQNSLTCETFPDSFSSTHRLILKLR